MPYLTRLFSSRRAFIGQIRQFPHFFRDLATIRDSKRKAFPETTITKRESQNDKERSGNLGCRVIIRGSD